MKRVGNEEVSDFFILVFSLIALILLVVVAVGVWPGFGVWMGKNFNTLYIIIIVLILLYFIWPKNKPE